jgi:glycosyltransferase involved in cell wall biosynthesis
MLRSLCRLVRILIDYRPALRERSGVGEYTHKLVEAFVRVKAHTDEVSLFSSSWKDRVADPGINGVTLLDQRVPVRVLTPLWNRGWLPVEQLTGGRFDVVHSAGPLMIPTRHASQVITIHDLDFLAHPERAQLIARRDYVRLVQRHSQQADHVIAISAYTAGDVCERLGVPPSRITVCRPGSPPWTPADRPASDPYVLFVGTLEPRKNVGLLLGAYSRFVTRRLELGQLSVPRLVLAGRAQPGSERWLQALTEPPLAGRATHLGYVPDADREGLYRGAAVLVLPSFNEGFGLPVLEAMTVGVPVIGSNRGAIPEVLGDSGLLVSPDEPQELAAALERLLTDSTLAEQCRARGIRRARLFDWASAARALREAYEEATARRAARARRERAG